MSQSQRAILTRGGGVTHSIAVQLRDIRLKSTLKRESLFSLHVMWISVGKHFNCGLAEKRDLK